MSPKIKDIRNFLFVLAGGVLIGVSLVYFMVRTEESGRPQLLHDTLLSPLTIETISNRAVRVIPGSTARYLIENIIFINPSVSKREIYLNIADYSAFYKEIQDDVSISLRDVPQDVIQSLNDPKLPSLAIILKEDAPYQAKGSVETFQVVYFDTNSGWYKVKVHTEAEDSAEWVYFQHKNLAKLFDKWMNK